MQIVKVLKHLSIMAWCATGAAYGQTETFQCVGPWSDEALCDDNSATLCLDQAEAFCGDHGGLSSYSCESCATYENPTLLGETPNTVREDTCPPEGGDDGIYNRLWIYCNN